MVRRTATETRDPDPATDFRSLIDISIANWISRKHSYLFAMSAPDTPVILHKGTVGPALLRWLIRRRFFGKFCYSVNELKFVDALFSSPIRTRSSIENALFCLQGKVLGVGVSVGKHTGIGVGVASGSVNVKKAYDNPKKFAKDTKDLAVGYYKMTNPVGYAAASYVMGWK